MLSCPPVSSVPEDTAEIITEEAAEMADTTRPYHWGRENPNYAGPTRAAGDDARRPPAFPVEDFPDEPECPECGNPVDSEGTTTGECPAFSEDRCEECYYCYCDGSC